MTHTKDELVEEINIIKDVVRHYGDMYCRWTLQFKMMRSMRDGMGRTLSDLEMVLALELIKHM